MNFEWNIKTISIMVVAAVVLIGTNIGQYFAIWKPKISEMTFSYEQEIAGLEETLIRIGPMVNVWTVNDGLNDLFAGRQIEPEDLISRELPESFVTSSLVLNPDTIIGKYYRIGLLPGTLMSMDMVMEDPMDDTIREYDVVASVMPIGLKVGDYVDYRIVYPLGEDYIVLPHKRVEAIHDKTIKLKLSETEIHYYQASLIDYFLQTKNGATLYLTKYLEPGVQVAATPYYAVPDNILAIMTADPNIMEKVNAFLNDTSRKIIDAGQANVSQEQGSVIASGRNEISGKIDAGKTEHDNTVREAEEAAKQAQAEAQLNGGAAPAVPLPGTISVETAPSQGTGTAPSQGTGTAPSQGTGTAPSQGTGSVNTGSSGNPLLEIEKGVVE
ncbi:SAF domain-containing protein [Paenibacillus sinopodophylli]|uniref:SAF domain-containing protein n=1 Tax=Paenibacillus sinopodophylli TaxID=1837342 RepID=UPI00110D0D80|nr:SAF domain-containing protein [Paenibacillus sinopodophylli]